MKIDEAIQVLKSFGNLDEDVALKQAIETVLKELEDKDKVVDEVKKIIRKHMHMNSIDSFGNVEYSIERLADGAYEVLRFLNQESD